MRLPLLKTTTAVVFLDDDERFLDTLSLLIPERFPLSLFTHPAELDARLSRLDEDLAEEQRLLGAVVDGGSRGALRCALDYLAWTGSDRIPGVLVSDHAMPAESGVSVCARHCHAFVLRRVLLTGVADAALAIRAVNEGAIDAFLSKNTPCLVEHLVGMLHEQSLRALEIRGRRLAEGLSACSEQLLSRPEIAAALTGRLSPMGLVAHVVVGDPLGVLGVSAEGQWIWVQIETVQSLRDLADCLHEMGVAPGTVQGVRECRALPNVELAAVFDGLPPRLSPLQALAATEPEVFAAVFDLSADGMALTVPAPLTLAVAGE